MNIIKRNIPNFITLANLACGLLSIISAFQGDFKNATLFIFLGVFFDFFDGLTARLLELNSELGKQLDSMADIVTFGVAPGFIFFHFMVSLDNDVILLYSSKENILFFPASLALLIPIFSAYRLANFNIDKTQIDSFIGLPTPALALVIASIPRIDFIQFPIFANLDILAIIAMVMPLLLVIKLPLFSLKFNFKKQIISKTNFFRISLIILSIILLFVFQFAAFPFIVILYLILSLINNAIKI